MSALNIHPSLLWIVDVILSIVSIFLNLLVLDTAANRPSSRSYPSPRSNPARATRVDALLRAELVAPVADAASTGGRPSRQFAFDGTRHAVLGVDIGATHVHLALTDLHGTKLVEIREELAVAEGPDAILGWVIEQGLRLCEQHQDRVTLRAVGVGLPGPVGHATGQPVDPPTMPGWARFDVPCVLRDALGVPIYVDNDVNVMALGEHHDYWSDVDDFLFVKVASGIGAGVIIGGRVHCGAQGIAGGIGHISVPEADGVECRCGSFGCLEAIAAGPAIAARLRANGADIHSSADIVAAVGRGDIDAVREVREAGRIIGRVLTTCVSLINPAVIALGGAVANAGDHLLAGAREVIYTRYRAGIGQPADCALTWKAGRRGIGGVGDGDLATALRRVRRGAVARRRLGAPAPA